MTSFKHELAVRPPFFEDILNGTKKFEIRLGDRQIAVGDILILKEFDQEHGYTGRQLVKKVTYVLNTNRLRFWPKEDVEKYGLSIYSLDSGWSTEDQRKGAIAHLSEIHRLSEQNRTDMHTFFYFLSWPDCPICQEPLVETEKSIAREGFPSKEEQNEFAKRLRQ